jgi:hypothetical protein
MYQDRYVKQRFLQTELSPEIWQSGAITPNSYFSVGEYIAAKKGKGNGLPVATKKELCTQFTQII